MLLRHLVDKDLGVKYWCIFALSKIGDRTSLSRIERFVVEKVGAELYDGKSVCEEALDAIAEISRHASE